MSGLGIAALFGATLHHAEVLRAACAPIEAARRAFISGCESFESLPGGWVLTVAGLICGLLALADLSERWRRSR